MATPTWPNEFAALSGDQPASKLDANFDAATQVNSRAGAPITPLIPTAGGEVGTDGFAANADHQHPPQSAAPTTIAGTTYTLTANDDGGVLETTSGSAVTIILENSLPVGFSCLVCQVGAGQVTFTPESGATLNNSFSYDKTRAQWSQVSLRVRANTGSAAVYVASGDMAS